MDFNVCNKHMNSNLNLKKLIYILRLEKYLYVEIGIKCFAVIFQFSPCTGQSEIVPGQSGLNKKVKNITNFTLKI